MRAPIFTLDDDCDGSLAGLATDLFFEAVDFARLAAAMRDSGRGLNLYIPRFEIIRITLDALVDALGLRFSERIPFIYNSATWTSPLPSGYTEGLDPRCPRPDEVIRSLMASCMSLRYGSPAGQRLEKAVTFIASKDGYNAALQYFFDIVDFGHVMHNSGEGYALRDLLQGRAAFKYDKNRSEDEACREWAHRRIPGMAHLKTAEDWLHASIGHGREVPPTTDELYDQRIVNRILALVSQTRNAANLTEFVVNQARLRRAISVLFGARHTLSDESVAPIPVALRSIDSQFEEMRVDAYVFVEMLADKTGPPTGSRLFQIGDTFASVSHGREHARERILAQRILSPNVLGELPVGGYTNLPDEWERLDYRIVNPLAALAETELKELYLMGYQTPLGSRVGQAGTREFWRRFTDIMFVPSQLDRIVVASAGIAAFPWSPQFRLELAIALDQANRPSEALAPARAAVFQEPNNKDNWQSYSVIMSRCGHADLARTARVIGTYLAQFHPVLAKPISEPEEVGE